VQAVVPLWLAFLALSGLTLFWTIAPGATLDGFAVLASQVLLFVALTVTRFDRPDLRRFETALVLGGVLVVGYGLAQLLFLGGLPVSEGGAGRFGDDLLGANNQAAALLLPLAIAAGRALAGSLAWRWVHAVAVALLMLGVLMTGSRGGLLAAVVVLGVAVALCRAARLSRIVLTAMGIVLLTVVLVVNPGGIGERQISRTDTSSGRTDIWAVGVRSCALYCMTGAGWGAFPTVYQEQLESVPEARVLRQGTAYEAHNILLLVGIEAGLLGLALIVVALALTLRDALRLPRWMRGPPVAAVLGTYVSSFFLSNLEFKFFWAVLTYVAVARAVAAAERVGGDGASPTAPPRTVPVGSEVR
jgi:O-antigen ligase